MKDLCLCYEHFPKNKNIHVNFFNPFIQNPALGTRMNYCIGMIEVSSGESP